MSQGTRTEPLVRRGPHWIGERDVTRDRDDWEREQRMQRQEDEQPQPSFGNTDTSGGEA